ncbi:type II toxin-antitoxin system VapC family toxin [Treponema sp.]|uniref:type II toxin-antitoxin system VapC family toxin n=1 Tax=Treponema sp. TaxID=166 RepID=UPI00298E0A04|nr:type II toxin-antitoxin system VapC family toxin [Treponema sp.]
MKYLVDSQTVIDFFNGKTELLHLFDDTENIYISAMSVGVLYEKILAAPKPDEKIKICKDFCQFLNVLPVDEAVAEKYAELKNIYESVDFALLWLCATAIVNDLVLVSSNPETSKVKETVSKKF